MDKKTHSQLLAEMLLLPFIREEFNTTDPISRYAAAYLDVIHKLNSLVPRIGMKF